MSKTAWIGTRHRFTSTNVPYVQALYIYPTKHFRTVTIFHEIPPNILVLYCDFIVPLFWNGPRFIVAVVKISATLTKAFPVLSLRGTGLTPPLYKCDRYASDPGVTRELSCYHDNNQFYISVVSCAMDEEDIIEVVEAEDGEIIEEATAEDLERFLSPTWSSLSDMSPSRSR